MTSEMTLVRFGFASMTGGAHLARTLSLSELKSVFDFLPVDAQKEDYENFVIAENGLKKRSIKSRQLTLKYLKQLYCLDPLAPNFRLFRWLWERDKDGRQMLALLMASTRDSLLGTSVPLIVSLPIGTPLSLETLQRYLVDELGTRFEPTTLKSLAQNIRSTWTQSGHLKGLRDKSRIAAKPTPGAVVFALYLGYVRGDRGLTLFQTKYCQLLDTGVEALMSMAAEAAGRDWLVMKNAGGIIDLGFPQHLSVKEREVLREQN